MPSLFPQSGPEVPLVGIARLAAQGEALSQGHQVDYLTLENRSLLTRCNSPRMPFAWMINPFRGCEFACKYCYARYTHEFMEMRDSLDFERKIYVKQHSAWLLRQELKQVRSGQSHCHWHGHRPIPAGGEKVRDYACDHGRVCAA